MPCEIYHCPAQSIIPIVRCMCTVVAAELNFHACLLHRFVTLYIIAEKEVIITAVKYEIDGFCGFELLWSVGSTGNDVICIF